MVTEACVTHGTLAATATASRQLNNLAGREQLTGEPGACVGAAVTGHGLLGREILAARHAREGGALRHARRPRPRRLQVRGAAWARGMPRR
jgi:hypothetical protein